MNWKAGALYHLTDSGNVYVNYAISQQPPGGNNFAPAQSGTGNSANRTDFKPQKAKTSEVGTKWELMDKRLLLTARFSVPILRTKSSKTTTAPIRSTVKTR